MKLENAQTARVLFPCGRVATVVVGERRKRKDSAVLGFVQEASVIPAVLIDHFAIAEATATRKAEESAAHVARVVAEVRTQPAKLTVIAGDPFSRGYSCGTVCGGTSVKKTNREERTSPESKQTVRRAKQASDHTGKLAKRREEKSWRTKEQYREGRKLALQNCKYLISPYMWQEWH